MYICIHIYIHINRRNTQQIHRVHTRRSSQVRRWRHISMRVSKIQDTPQKKYITDTQKPK